MLLLPGGLRLQHNRAAVERSHPGKNVQADRRLIEQANNTRSLFNLMQYGVSQYGDATHAPAFDALIQAWLTAGLGVM